MVINANTNEFGKIEIANSRIHKMLGYISGELIGINVYLLMPSVVKSIHN